MLSLKLCTIFNIKLKLIKTKTMRQETRQKILLLLLGGVALGLSKSPRGYFKIIKNASKEWKEIKRKRLYCVVKEFYNDRLVDYKEDKNGVGRRMANRNF